MDARLPFKNHADHLSRKGLKAAYVSKYATLTHSHKHRFYAFMHSYSDGWIGEQLGDI